MPKLLALWLGLSLLGTAAACGGGSDQDDSSAASVMPPLFTRENWSELDAAPDRYVGALVDVVGKVLQTIEPTSEGTFWVMYIDPTNYRHQTMVAYLGQEIDVARDDYVRVRGQVLGVFSGMDRSGSAVGVPALTALEIDIVDAMASAPESIRTVEGSFSQSRHGMSVALVKVEFASTETRVFVTVKNDSASPMLFLDFDAQATQGDRRFDPFLVGHGDYPRIAAEIAPDVASSGVIVFPLMDPDAHTQLILKVTPADTRLSVDAYVFDIPGTS